MRRPRQTDAAACRWEDMGRKRCRVRKKTVAVIGREKTVRRGRGRGEEGAAGRRCCGNRREGGEGKRAGGEQGGGGRGERDMGGRCRHRNRCCEEAERLRERKRWGREKKL